MEKSNDWEMCQKMIKKRLSERDCFEFLEKISIGRLGTSLNNEPYVIPVHFILFHDKIYIHTGFKGKKLDILKINPLVCFEASRQIRLVPADKACKFSVEFISVIVTGKASIIYDAETKYEIMKAFTKKYSLPGTEPELKMEDMNFICVLEIFIDQLSGRECSNQ